MIFAMLKKGFCTAPSFALTVPMSQIDLSRPSLFEESTRPPIAGSCLPNQADEVLEVAKDIRQTLDGLLRKQKLQVRDIELRRRLSTREFRAYITLSTPMDIEHLANIEHLLRAEVNRSNCIEIANIFWTYKAQAH